MTEPISSDEWLAALEQAVGKTDTGKGMTTREIADLLGMSYESARRKVRSAVTAGEIECLGRGIRMSMAGERSSVPVYRVKKKAVKKKKKAVKKKSSKKK